MQKLEKASAEADAAYNKIYLATTNKLNQGKMRTFDVANDSWSASELIANSTSGRSLNLSLDNSSHNIYATWIEGMCIKQAERNSSWTAASTINCQNNVIDGLAVDATTFGFGPNGNMFEHLKAIYMLLSILDHLI